MRDERAWIPQVAEAVSGQERSCRGSWAEGTSFESPAGREDGTESGAGRQTALSRLRSDAGGGVPTTRSGHRREPGDLAQTDDARWRVEGKSAQATRRACLAAAAQLPG